jgi:hypothetical protein
LLKWYYVSSSLLKLQWVGKCVTGRNAEPSCNTYDTAYVET